jgi:hypothetical protein
VIAWVMGMVEEELMNGGERERVWVEFSCRDRNGNR